MMLLSPRVAWISPTALLLTGLIFSSHATAQTQAQPRPTNQRALPQSVILRGDAYSSTIQQLHVVRQYPLSSVRSNPQVALGDARLDFTPMLTNPKALFNVAERLRAMPQQVQVQEQSSDVTEIDQGLVIHEVLTYRILPGKCADQATKSQLASAGVSCFTQATASERIAEFSRPGSPRYVADPEKRQAAIAAYQHNSALEDAEATKHIADLRQALADPTRRAAITAQIGPQEAARLQTLNDDQLRDYVINSSVQRVEETSFVPRLQSSIYAKPVYNLRTAPSMAEISAGQALSRGATNGDPAEFPKLLRLVPSSAYHNLGNSTGPGGDKISDLDLGTYYYLTGFTLGHDYEWSREVDVTVNWCIFGCSSTYSIKVYAGFNYGFGLRFPIQVDLKYHSVVHANNSAQATTTATFEPIQGNVQDFEDTGLSSDQLFNGKELVAQVGAYAGYNVNLPVLGGSNTFSIGVDFTNYLPPPYTGGIFQPPAPGTGGINSNFIFSQFDLLGGLLNFGIVGGQVFPAVKLNLHSDKLQFTLTDEILNKPTLVNATGQSINVAVNNAAIHDSHFKFGNPVYNLGFTLTPGIAANLFVDIAVWSDNWTWPIWFPQLAVTVPSGGVDFSCHAGTTCVLDFQPEHQEAVTGGIDQQLNGLGCRQQGSAMACPTYRGYLTCLNDLNSHPLGIQSCDPGMALKQGQAADRTLTGGGCQRIGSNIGNYACPGEGGMLGLCQTMLNNGAVLGCSLLVPTSTDQILRRGGCKEDPGPPGTYSCPTSMMGLCQLYVKNRVILACKQGN
jgi:hypothetical protein